jgi:hypothetical protein
LWVKVIANADLEHLMRQQTPQARKFVNIFLKDLGNTGSLELETTVTPDKHTTRSEKGQPT